MIIGVVGIGIMGGPMARNLLKAGHEVHVHTRTPSKAESLLAQGARWQDSPADLAKSCDVILSIVPDSPDVQRVYLGPNGICSTLRSGSLCIDMSTVSPEVAMEVAGEVLRRGSAFVDAPVSGGKTGAEAATLTIMVGGSEANLHQAEPVFQALGKIVVHCGPVGSGQRAKLCNQILCGLNLLAVSEALVFAKRIGLDPAVMLQAVSTGAAGSWAVNHLGPRMLARDFAPMFMVDLQRKDLRIALEMAEANKVPLPGTALVAQLLTANQSAGEGREGTQALIKTLERLCPPSQQESA